MQQRNAVLVHGNALRLGLFGANCSSGRTYATLAERWDASWENNVRLAQLADEVGIECMIPIARWKGYGGESNPNGSSFESIAWACGLLAVTRRLNVFCTVHVPLHHPRRRQADGHSGPHWPGRPRRQHRLWLERGRVPDVRGYATRARRALRAGRRMVEHCQAHLAGEAPFDYAGTHYQLRGVEGAPRPYGAHAPLMMNAGSSPAGRQFAIRHSDMHFDGVHTPEASIERIAETKRLARERGRDIQVWTPVGIVCRPTQQEADDYVQYVVDHADWGALGYLADMHERDARTRTDPEGLLRRSGTNTVERRPWRAGPTVSLVIQIRSPRNSPGCTPGFRRPGAQLCRLSRRTAVFCRSRPASAGAARTAHHLLTNQHFA